ncbi:unnamed protein product [Phytomonas sp. EM1]|nr:unnamed protein product [Phytomonas sp. EM1]|eukprot:CCW62439.1 unnamed protein product [Phytomonas sp. isolate EM1]
MSGLPFNAMQKKVPPPTHIDTAIIDPVEFAFVSAGDNYVFIAHQECLQMSPFLRRALTKKAPLHTDNVWIDFDALNYESNDLSPPNVPGVKGQTVPKGDRATSEVRIRISFPKATPLAVDILLSYLYYKRKYEGNVNTKRPELGVPASCALELLKLSNVLEC